MNQILIISFWNPIPLVPKKGLFIFEQVNAVCKRRNDVVFLEVNILPAKQFFYKTISEIALHTNKVITINIYSLFWKLILVNPWLLYWLLQKYLKAFHLNKPKIIHSNIIFPCAIVGYLLAKKWNAKHIISEHWSQIEKYAKHPIFKRLITKVYNNCKAIMPVSDFLAKKIRTVTENPNVFVIPNVIDTQLFTYVPKVQDSEELRFSCVAAWEEPKRLDLIVTSLASFAKNSPKNIILNVIGGGSQTKDFSSFRCPSNLTINWIGYISKPEIAKFLTKTDIFLQASEIETFSIVTAEALSTGTPVLVSNVGALPEFINADNGVLVENILEAWISGLQAITEKKYDNQKIALEICGKYSPDSVAAKIESIYNTLLISDNI